MRVAHVEFRKRLAPSLGQTPLTSISTGISSLFDGERKPSPIPKTMSLHSRQPAIPLNSSPWSAPKAAEILSPPCIPGSPEHSGMAHFKPTHGPTR